MVLKTGDLEQRKYLWTLNVSESQLMVRSALGSPCRLILLTVMKISTTDISLFTRRIIWLLVRSAGGGVKFGGVDWGEEETLPQFPILDWQYWEGQLSYWRHESSPPPPQYWLGPGCSASPSMGSVRNLGWLWLWNWWCCHCGAQFHVTFRLSFSAINTSGFTKHWKS